MNITKVRVSYKNITFKRCFIHWKINKSIRDTKVVKIYLNGKKVRNLHNHFNSWWLPMLWKGKDAWSSIVKSPMHKCQGCAVATNHRRNILLSTNCVFFLCKWEWLFKRQFVLLQKFLLVEINSDSVLISNWKQKLSFMGVILKSLKTRQKFHSCLYCFLCSSYCKNDKKKYALKEALVLFTKCMIIYIFLYRLCSVWNSPFVSNWSIMYYNL